MEVAAGMLTKPKDNRSFKRQLRIYVQDIQQELNAAQRVFHSFVKEMAQAGLLNIETSEKQQRLDDFWEDSGYAQIAVTIEAVMTQVRY